MIQPSQREKLLIITTGIVLFVVLSFFVGKPLINAWKETSAQYDSKKQERELVRATLERQPELEKKYDELVKKSNTANRPAAVPDVLQTLDQIAREAGVTVRSQTPEPPRDKGGFTEVAVNYSMDATIETLVKFLYSVRTAQDLLDVTELKVTQNPANPSILRTDVRLVSLRAGGK